MLEKSGNIVLTQGDLEKYRREEVSDRVKQTWGLTFKQLQEVVESNNYVLQDTTLKAKE